MTVIPARPNPVMDALRRVGPAASALVGLVAWLGTSGVLSAAQTAAITEYAGEISAATAPTGPISIGVGGVIGLIAGGSTLLGILKAGKGATDETTPIKAPQDVDGTPLVRADGLPLGGNPYAADATAPTSSMSFGDPAPRG